MLAIAILVGSAAGCSGGGSDSGDGPDGTDWATTTETAGEDVPVVGGTLRAGVGRLSSLDPADASPESPSAAIVADLLFDTLTVVAPGEAAAAPGIAESWGSGDGGVNWTFTIDSDARFSDGRAITAADVAFSLERLVSRGNGSLVASRLDAVAGFADFVAAGGTAAGADLPGVTAVDDTTVAVTLTRAMAWLPELLSAPAYGIVSQLGVTTDGASFAEGPSVSSGPFRLAERDGDILGLVRAPDRRTYLDRVELHQFDDLGVAFDRFDGGELDWSLLPPGRADVAAERYGTEGFVPFQAELFFGFNLASPTFADVRFRQAIVQAVDRQALVNAVYFGQAEPLAGIVPTGVAGADPTRCAAGCATDSGASQALLAQAFPNGGIPEVVLDFADGADETAVAGIIEQNLEAIGIPVTLRPHAAADYGAFAVSGNQAFISLGWIGVQGSPEDYVSRLFHTGSVDNLTGFSDANVDLLLDQAASVLDADARITLVGQAEAAVLALAPILPLAQFKVLSVAAEPVRDLVLGVNGTFDAEAVWLAP